MSSGSSFEFKNRKPLIREDALIGAGCFGTVYPGRLKRDDRSCPAAFKLVLIDDYHFQRELNILKKLKNLFVVDFYGSCDTSWGKYVQFKDDCTSDNDHMVDCRCLVMELCDGNLDEYVRGRSVDIPKGVVDPKLINGQVTVGLSYLHGKGIVHRDLKPQNILMCRISPAVVLVKIADFGISKQERGQHHMFPHVVDVQESSDGQSYGTSGFMAPESLSSPGSLPKFESDVWALGVVIFFVLSDGQHPFGRRLVFGSQDLRDTIIQKLKILRNVAPIVDDWAATDLVLKLLDYQPAERPSVFAVLYHPYFTLTDKRKKLFLAKKMFQLALEHEQGHSLFRRMFHKQKVADWCASYCEEQSTDEDEQCLTLLTNVFLVDNLNSFHFEFFNCLIVCRTKWKKMLSSPSS